MPIWSWRVLMGPMVTSFAAAAELAKSQNVAIVYGYPELGEDDQRYNSVLCVSAAGEVLANHRKRALPTPYEQDLFVTGSEPCVFTLDNGRRAALLICYEVEFPEAVRAAAVAGAEIVIVPTALGNAWGVVARQVVPTRAFENGVFLMYANYAGEERETTYLGESVIVSPMGVDLARAGDGEAVDCDLIGFRPDRTGPRAAAVLTELQTAFNKWHRVKNRTGPSHGSNSGRYRTSNDESGSVSAYGKR